MVPTPLILITGPAPGAPVVCWICTPATCPTKASENETTALSLMFSALTLEIELVIKAFELEP